ncbi:MAG: hypothetical protein AB8G18_10195 [Gammaproteobacteria bacterium]
MNKVKLLLLALVPCISLSSFAATEYIRLQGTVGSDPALDLPDGLIPGQFLYFDIEFDVTVDPAGFSDQSSFNFFEASFYAGNYAVDVSYGYASFDASFRRYRGFSLNQPLRIERVISCDFDFPPPHCTTPSLGFDWDVGTIAFLESGSQFFSDTLSVLEVTYRGSEPPPPIPLPAGLWLFISALGALCVTKKQ